MSSILFGLIVAAMLSVSSLVAILLRVSPLTAPYQAIPAFFLSLFLSAVTLGALLMLSVWRNTPHHTWDMGKVTSISIREGVFLGLATVILLIFHLLQLLNWWIAILIYLFFILVELALTVER